MPHLVPASVGPRLQTGDLFISGESRQCRVTHIHRNKVVARVVYSSREFTVSVDFATRHRCRTPNKLTHTTLLLAALRKGVDPPGILISSAAGEGHLGYAVDRQGSCALVLAASRGLSSAVDAMLRFDVAVDLADASDGETALMKAARRGHVDLVRALLANGATVDAATSCGGFTALMLASASGQREVCHVLLKHGASVDLRERSTCDRSDAIRLACVHGHLAVAQLLAAFGASLPPASAAATSKISAWLQAGARWSTPLHFIEGMPYERARELLRSGADVHALGGDQLPSPVGVALQLERDGKAAEGSAARAVIDASDPWRPEIHDLLPLDERERAYLLLCIGYRLASMHGGAQSHALVEVWLSLILPKEMIRYKSCEAADKLRCWTRKGLA